MMNLDEAIRHCEEVARQNEEDAIVYSNCKKYKKNLYEIGLAENAEKKCCKCAEEHRQLAEWLKELKQLREQTRWIPVSERLPEENGRYIVFLNSKIYPIRILHFAKNLNEISSDFNCNFKSEKAGWYDYDSEYGFFERTGIEAWMPLPEPYKAECEEV